MNTKPELLAPAGGLNSLKAAVEAGADAVYFGARQFNARAVAENFEQSGLAMAIDYCHRRGVLAYLTLNTLYTDNELPEVLALAAFALREGADALIVQDLGFAAAIKERFPDCVLHASTQMTVQTAEDARFLRGLGFSRAVLARELTMEEIGEVSEINTKSGGGLETEVFVHGAMCMGYSGQCLLSWQIGGRSANRGECAQPCRLPFKFGNTQGHLLSPKDLSALDLVPKLAALGVRALKIEGRAKSPEYVYIATRAYRHALDNCLTNTDKLELEQIFNRGFSRGFLAGAKPGAASMSVVSPGHMGAAVGKVVRVAQNRCTIQADAVLNPGDGLVINSAAGNIGTNVNRRVEKGGHFSFTFNKTAQSAPKIGAMVYRNFDKELDRRTKILLAQDTRQITAEARVEISQNLSSIELRHTRPDGTIITVRAEGEAPEQASSRPLTRAEVITRLSKTGGSGVTLEFVKVSVGEGLFMPVSALNNLRRSAVSSLQEAVAQSYKRKWGAVVGANCVRPQDSRVYSRANREIAIQANDPTELKSAITEYTRQGITVKRVYVEAGLLAKNTQAYRKACPNIPLFAALPPVGECLVPITELAQYSDGFLVRTWGQINATEGFNRVLDYTIHAYNSAALQVLGRYGIPTVHPEATSKNPIELCRLRKKVADSSHFLRSDICEMEVFRGCPEIPQPDFAAPEYEYISHPLPLLISRRCLKGMYGACRTGNSFLIDRKGVKYPIITGCELNLACHSRLLDSTKKIYYNQHAIDSRCVLRKRINPAEAAYKHDL